jgi:hypothetical protein
MLWAKSENVLLEEDSDPLIGYVCERNGMEWNGIVHEIHFIPQKLFLKLTPTFLFLHQINYFLSLFK